MGNKLKKLIYFGLIVSLLTLVACSPSTDTDADEQTNSNDEQTSDTRVLTDAVGNEVEVPANPERVIASYLEDHLIALDITPVAQWSIQDGASVQDYLQDHLQNVDTIPSELPFEAVASFNPDLIILPSASSVEEGTYDQYAQIAPTYIVSEETNEDWRENLQRIAEVFGLEEQAEQVLSDYEAKASEASQLIEQAIGDQSAAAIWFVADTFYIVGDAVSSGAVLYQDLGIAVPAVVEEVSSAATGNWSPISLEKLAELDADHIFLINSSDSGEVFDDPIWSNIPAVAQGNVYEYAAETSWLYSGTIANEQIIEAVLANLTTE
ncbi:iron complex transport system substrate-binding protein [Amphibacillus marinus]|uniref:Iron complex transport system substrate-binding protein n=1 Tax=Amphibacillus marinus TaxID=872970 RepID=A0A1H8LQD7_9BACI|nr:iron-hydroxamate ABC transporter substrate-binding protein [Amphibacillus marinus]SEO07372.1 iron complex transport system substrate-binding protein [Amphibacillus marinus]